MNRQPTIWTILTLITAPAFAQPALSQAGALNSASYVLPGLPNAGVAQGSLFVLFGSGLGPSQLLRNAAFPLGTQLGGTSVRVSIGSASIDAFPIYTVATQVAAVLPSNAPIGEGTVTVTYNGRASGSAPIRVVKNAFGTFSRNQAGNGPAIVQNYVSPTQAPLNALNNAAHPGQVLILWGTGLGAISGSDAALPPAGNLDVDVQVLVGGVPAKILYKGRSPEFPGIDQINFETPPGVEGCYVPVAVKAGGIVSNFTSIAVTAAGSTCSDPTGIAAADLDTAARNGQSKIGFVSLSRTWFSAPSAGVDFRIDGGFGQFFRRDMNAVITSRGLFGLSAALGTCTALTYAIDPRNPDSPDVNDPVVTVDLAGGAALNLTGPRGTKQIKGEGSGSHQYNASLGGGAPGAPSLPDYLEPGDYTINNALGGPDVGGFSATLTLPQTLTWTNPEVAAAVSRDADLTVTWTGGDPNREFVFIDIEATNKESGVRGFVACTERIAAGRLTIPADALSVLPASSAQTNLNSFPPGVMEVGTATLLDKARSAAPGLDGMYFYAKRTMMTLAAVR